MSQNQQIQNQAAHHPYDKPLVTSEQRIHFLEQRVATLEKKLSAAEARCVEFANMHNALCDKLTQRFG